MLQIQGLFAIVTGLFDIYALALAAPGSSHYGFYLFSYDFVYSGNPHGKIIGLSSDLYLMYTVLLTLEVQ